jgi:acyl-CoA dehydrogenase
VSIDSNTSTAADSTLLDELCAGLRMFVRAEVVPRHEKLPAAELHQYYDTAGRFHPEILRLFREVRMASAEAGFYTCLAPAEVGGGGLGYVALFRLWETLFETCGSKYWLGHQTLGHWSRALSHLHLRVDPGFRAEILPALADGSQTSCFAMSEPDAGSDIWRMGTTATRVDGGWVVNGTKQWVTNAPYAEWMTVFAVTDRAAFSAKRGGLTGFIVAADSPGLRVDSVLAMFGHSGGDEGIISFEDVFVPDRQVIGEPGEGLRYAMSGISMGRMYNSARAVGVGHWALQLAVEYAEQRVTFGKPLIENQAIAFPLAESAMELHASRLVGLDAATDLDAGIDARLKVSISKAYAVEAAIRAVDRSIQVHGAMGLTNEMHLTEAWQQMRRTNIADGSAEMMRIQIAKFLRSK